MKAKDTDSLQQELMSTPNLNDFLASNSESFQCENVADYLTSLLSQKDLSKATVARRAEMSEIYLHQIFAGRRKPSRNRLLCICYGLGATVNEAQELLKLCGLAQLYPKNRRDAIILFGMAHGSTLSEINDKLFLEDEEALY